MTTDNMQEETPSTLPAEPTPAEPVKKKRTGLIVSLVVAGVLLVGGGTAFYFVKASQADEKEQTAYDLLENNYDIQDFEDFLTNYPESSYAADVEERMRKLKNMQDSWNNICTNGRQSDFVSFKERFSDERYDKMCDDKIDSLDWVDAQRLNTKEAYSNYLTLHPNGRYAAEASMAQSTTERFSVDEMEKMEVARVLESFFQAFSQNDEPGICAYITPVMDTFLSQKQVTKAEVVKTIGNMFTDEIINCTFTTNNDFIVTKVAGNDGGTDYKVDFSVDQRIERSNPGKTFGSYTATAFLNAQFQIKALTMTEVSRQTSSENN